jgi:hypothetical protein
MSGSTYELSCDCGAVTLTVHGAPEISLYCHCGSCRALYNSDILSATVWSDDNVDLPSGDNVYEFAPPDKQMRRFGCSQCGTVMYARHRPGMPVIPQARLRKANGGEVPAELAPAMHLFYAERVLEIDDSLPKSEGAELLSM